MPPLPICPNCGARQRRPDARYCYKCGYSLAAVLTDSGVGHSSRSPRSIAPWWWMLLIATIVIAIIVTVLLLNPAQQHPSQSPAPVVTKSPATVTRPPSPATKTPTAQPTSTSQPLLTPTMQPTRPKPTVTPTSSPTPKPTAIATQAPLPIPEVHTIEQRLVYNNGKLVIHKDIHFRDPDGDAYLVTYQVIQSDIKHYHVEDDPITAPSDQQKQDAIVTATWQCGSKNYRITLRTYILDRAGHRSQPFDLVYDCHY